MKKNDKYFLVLTVLLSISLFNTTMSQSNETLLKTGTIKSNGINLYYEIHGTGEPLILIEGLGAATYLWEKQVPELSKHFTVIVYDNRGVGKSDKPAGPYTIGMMSDDLFGLMEAIAIPKAHILGVSMGGFIAQDFAIKHPDKVNKLILGCTSSGGKEHVPMSKETLMLVLQKEGKPIELMKKKLALAYTQKYLKDEANMNHLIELRVANPPSPEGFQAQAVAGATFDQSKNVVNIKAECLILSADEDVLVPMQNAFNLKNKIPNSTMKIYNHLGHQFFVEGYNQFNKDVIDFLKEDKSE